VNVTDLCSAGSESLARRALLALHESRVGGEILDALESFDLENLVENGHGEDFSDAGNGAKPEEVLGVMDLGFSGEEELKIHDEQIVVTGELDVGGDALENGRVRELLGDALSVAPIVDASLRGRKVVLVVGVLNVSEEMASLAHQGEPAAQEIPSRAHLGRVDIGLREHSSPKQRCDLERIDAVVFCFASVNRLHVQSVAENEVDALSRAKVGKPVPGEDAFHRDDKGFADGAIAFKKTSGSVGKFR
jgi:hypothetical protein